MDNFLVGEKIKAVRKKEKLTQEDFAHKIGLSRSTIAQIETGKANPTFETIFTICTMFKVDPHFFISQAENMTENVHPNVYPNVYLSGNNNKEQADIEQAFFEHAVRNTDKKNTFRKVKRAFKIGDLYQEFEQIVDLVYEYQGIIGHYDIQTQIDVIHEQNPNINTFQELQKQLVTPVENFTKMIGILSKYKECFENLHADIVDFNNSHDKHDWL